MWVMNNEQSPLASTRLSGRYRLSLESVQRLIADQILADHNITVEPSLIELDFEARDVQYATEFNLSAATLLRSESLEVARSMGARTPENDETVERIDRAAELMRQGDIDGAAAEIVRG